MEGVWPEGFRERVITKARFRETSGDPSLLYVCWRGRRSAGSYDIHEYEIDGAEVNMEMGGAAAENAEDMLLERATVSTTEVAFAQSAISMEPSTKVMMGACRSGVPVGAAAVAVSTMVVETGDTEDMLLERASSRAVSTTIEAREAVWGANQVEPSAVVMGGAGCGAAKTVAAMVASGFAAVAIQSSETIMEKWRRRPWSRQV